MTDDRARVNLLSFGDAADPRKTDAVFAAALAAGVPLFVPAGAYVLHGTLRLPSGTDLLADGGATVKLADGAQRGRHDFLLTAENAENIRVCGGTWDGNAAGNDRGNDLFDPAATTGTLFNFRGVRGVTLADLTLKNPLCYFLRFCEAEDVTVTDIAFSSDHAAINQDGVHLAGGCRNFTIRNLRGADGSPGDDFVALNADDCVTRQENFDTVCGDIENITVENVISGGCHCFVRLLSVDHAIRGVTVRNVGGAFRNGAVNLDASRYCRTPLFRDADRPRGVGCIENVLLENFNVRGASGAGSCIDLETNCRALTVRQFVAAGKPPLLVLRKTAAHTLTLRTDREAVDRRFAEGEELTVHGGRIDLLTFDAAD